MSECDDKPTEEELAHYRKAFQNIINRGYNRKKRKREAAKPPRDAYGNLVPARLEAVFKDKGLLENARECIRGAEQILYEVGRREAGACFDARTLINDLQAIRTKIYHGSPLRKCTCDADEYNCELCDGRRWVSVKRILESGDS